MTAYGDRRRAGYYDPDGTAGPTQSTVYADDGGTTVQVDESTEPTLAELREQAEALGLKSYGTKADIAQRIAESQGERT